jgi:hypothetical protein
MTKGEQARLTAWRLRVLQQADLQGEQVGALGFGGGRERVEGSTFGWVLQLPRAAHRHFI